MLLTGGVYSSKLLPIIGHALASDTMSTGPTGWVYDTIILMFAALVALIVAGLFYAGFVAKPKNTVAATAVAHFVTFASGVLMGLFNPKH